MSKWLITGANGNLGRRLLAHLLARDEVVAVVRSDKAANTIREIDLAPELKARLQVTVLSYTDVQALKAAADGCDYAVHLVGILKEGGGATYYQAHEASTEALVAALQGTTVKHISYLSIVGSKPEASNACLASKGAAEQILLSAEIPGCVLRVPMVLGEGDYASFALRKRAQGGTSFSFRAASLEQPIYAGDVVTGIVQAADLGVTGALDLAGPSQVTRRELTERAASVLGRQAKVISLPMGLGYTLAYLLERLSGNPPFTVAMLGVLDHDDAVDAGEALGALQMTELTPLDEALAKVLT